MRRRLFIGSGAAAVGFGCLGNSLFGTESTWQNWRGSNRDGLIPGAAWPDWLDEKTLRPVLGENKIEGYMSSPLIIDHFVYMHLRNKRFACMDLQTALKTMADLRWTTA